MEVAAEGRFHQPSNEKGKRAGDKPAAFAETRSVSSGINYVLTHGDRLGRNAEVDLRLFHHGHRVSQLLSLLDAFDVNCGLTFLVGLWGGGVADRDHCVLDQGSTVRKHQLDNSVRDLV